MGVLGVKLFPLGGSKTQTCLPGQPAKIFRFRPQPFAPCKCFGSEFFLKNMKIKNAILENGDNCIVAFRRLVAYFTPSPFGALISSCCIALLVILYGLIRL